MIHAKDLDIYAKDKGILDQGHNPVRSYKRSSTPTPIDHLRFQGHLQNISKAMGHVTQRHSAVYELLKKAQVNAMISALCAVAETCNVGLPLHDTFNGNNVLYSKSSPSVVCSVVPLRCMKPYPVTPSRAFHLDLLVKGQLQPL
ncbi:hypothetical protein IE81DRAFT_350188 [Ceraceosorus guamensis]|uniref:Uncharacterized protein n=1 Tax=Ceraceosorus guamensis TaxID=1522189 RepID=A0A316VQ21_9BASI|nr:hypothetical protein IE81DRAFT_350188 [Ceraceosorus guamensis]PWN39430.1 hypothetical protein IE81DRAFT_350188 [Ceraceosorus guamensis]